MFSIQVDWNVKMIKRLQIVQNTKKTIELSNMGEKGKIAHERQKTRWKCRNNPTFFRPTKEANDKNEISAVYMPNSSQIQTNKTKETQQVTLSFISK